MGARAPRCSRRDLRVLRTAIDKRLASLVSTPEAGSPLDKAVRYALLAPGKRIRPFLTMLAAAELGADELDALDAGCALEMVHAASLILDDLPSMDDAPSRRGQPSTHVVFGEDGAILAAVSLLSRSYGAVGQATRLSAETRCELVAILAQAVGTAGLAGGQFQDLRPAEAQLDRITDANHLKTGMLFVAAVEMAVAIAGADAFHLDRMRAFATHLGQAFQLRDDLLDGDGAEPGAGEDAGKATLLSVLGPGEVRRRLDLHVAHALRELALDGMLARFVRGIFDDEAARAAPTERNGATMGARAHTGEPVR
jgi:geranylgeranyl diphosphate synthase type II